MNKVFNTKIELYFQELITSIFNPEKTKIDENKNIYFEHLYDYFRGVRRVICKPFIETFEQMNEELLSIEYANPTVAFTTIDDMTNLNRYEPIFEGKNIIVFGLQILNFGIINNPIAWWIFNIKVIGNKTINIDYEKSVCYIDEKPAILANIIPRIEIPLSSIEELGTVGISQFINDNLSKKPAIIVGNGVSIPFGSDNWTKLSETLIDYLNPKYVDSINGVKSVIGNNVYSNTSISKYLIEEEKFNNALYNSIYRKYEPDMHVRSTLVRVLTKYKYINKDIPLLTYNYDNFIEIDYEMAFGESLSSVASSIDDNVTTEPKIKHLHGIIGYKNRLFKNVVLTQEEYFEKYKGNNWIVTSQKDVLKNNACLYVGSSMSDIFQLSLIESVKNQKIKKNENWTCYALLCSNGLDNKDKVMVYNYFLDRGITIIFSKSYEELPNVLSRVLNVIV